MRKWLWLFIACTLCYADDDADSYRSSPAPTAYNSVRNTNPADNKYRNADPAPFPQRFRILLFPSFLPSHSSTPHSSSVSEAHSPEQQCAVGLHVAWTSTLGAGGLSAPIVADFNNDGRKEVVWSTVAVFVEALLARDGSKAEGWPFPLAQSLLVASPLLYDVDNSGTLDVVVTTEAGEIVFVEQSGVPMYNATLKIGPLPLSKDLLSEASRIAESDWWYKLKRRDYDKVPNRYRNRGQIKGLDHDDDDLPTDRRGNELPEESDLTAAGLKSLELFLTSSLPSSYAHGLRQQLDPLYSPSYVELLWYPNTEFLVPPHVIATPVICDLERDGHDELIVPVSYFFSAAQGARGTPFGGDSKGTAKIAVAGLVAFDLKTRHLKWQMELSGSHLGDQHAYMYSSPVCADLTGDGVLEIVVADGDGYVHVLDAGGTTVAPWPVQMASVAAQVVVEDLDGDGRMEILVLDAKGNLVSFDVEAKELWLQQVFTGSDPPLDHAPTVGDIDGNGVVDVVLGTAAGLLYAWDATSGAPLAGYPLVFPDPIRAEVALVKLDARSRGLHLVFPAGVSMYIVAGANPSCLDSVALGEESYAPVAVDDFTGDGKLDFLVTCANGHVFCLATEIPYHPLNTWSTPWSGGTKVATNYEYHGIYARNREVRDVVGGALPLHFEIVDKRQAKAAQSAKPRSFDVSIAVNGATVFRQRYNGAGSYLAQVPAPTDRTSASITLWMENEAHQVFTDYFSVSFNIRFHRLLKYVLVLPFALIVLLLGLSANARQSNSLPLGETQHSHHHHHHHRE